MTGGIPIYPGGFSCVFKPQLKCKLKYKNKTKRKKYSKITQVFSFYKIETLFACKNIKARPERF